VAVPLHRSHIIVLSASSRRNQPYAHFFFFFLGLHGPLPLPVRGPFPFGPIPFLLGIIYSFGGTDENRTRVNYHIAM